MAVADTVVSWGQGELASIAPWHSNMLCSLEEQQAQQRLGHAYLLAGEKGTGIEQFANVLAAGVLCDSEGMTACGECVSCQLCKSGSHPDVFFLTLQDASVIKVDQVRRAIQFASETASRGGYRCIVISPAEAMNINAANALLKLLEEPGDKTLLLLVSYSSAALLPTIASRCQKLNLPMPSASDAKQWLLSHGVDESVHDAYYLARPIQAVLESKDGGIASYLLVKSHFHGCMRKELSIESFVSETKAIDPIALVDHLYSLCVEVLKSKPHLCLVPAVNSGLDELLRYKRAILNGSTENQALFYQTWWQHWLRNIR